MMTLLAGAATVTERVRIEATVSVTPMHAAIHVAKQAATIDVLSDGRFVLGVGVGGRDEDYRAMGADVRPPARDARRTGRDDAARVGGASHRPKGAAPVGPAPVQPGGPPVLAGVDGPEVDGPRRALGRRCRRLRHPRRCRGRSAAGSAGSRPRGPTPAATDVRSCRRRSGSASARTRPSTCATTPTGTCASSATTPRDAMAELAHGHLAPALRDRLAAIERTGCDEVILVATTADLDDLARAADVVVAR